MKRNAFLLILASLLCTAALLCLAASCAQNLPPETSTDIGGTEPVPTEEQTEPAPLTEYTFVKDGKCMVALVRPDRDDSDQPSVINTVAIRKALASYCTDSPLITTDWDTGRDPLAYEIQIGCVDSEESRSITDSLGYGEYVMKLVGRKIIVNGLTEKTAEAAAQRLIELLEKYKTVNADNTVTIVIPVSELSLRSTKDPAYNVLPKLSNQPFDYTLSAGKIIATDYFYFNNVNNDSLKTYLSAVETMGYIPVLSDASASKPFYGFKSATHTLNVALNKQARRIEVTMRKIKNASDYYGLCVKDTATVRTAPSADAPVSTEIPAPVKYDTFLITKIAAGGWNEITVNGKVGYVKDTELRVFPNLSELKGYAAVVWARDIAADNDFHYGHNDWAHHHGCYFCGTNGPNGTKVKNGANYEDQLKTYCCNPFVTAAFCHGAGAVKAGADVTKAVSCTGDKINLANDTNVALSKVRYFALIDKPDSIRDLLPGDILLTPTHAMLVSENGNIVDASGGDDNVKNSDRWNNSIREHAISSGTWGSVSKVYRYVGD